LVRANLQHRKLPTMLAEVDQLARAAAERGQRCEQDVLRLTELEVAARAAKALPQRIQQARFPTGTSLETVDFTAPPRVGNQPVRELARGEWLRQTSNGCFLGNSGTGNPPLAAGLGRAACHAGSRGRFFTAAAWVNKVEEAHQQQQVDRLLSQRDRAALRIVAALGDLSFRRTGAELLLPGCAERSARRSLVLTRNRACREWGQVLQGARMTAAFLDRWTPRCHILARQGARYRFREARKAKGTQKAKE
jgi:DNA replication protein DnaC